MAPKYPDEVDVFTVPHSRMKQLVHKYLDMVSSTNFQDVGHMTSVLEKLCHTFHEFKTHEQIENRFIMRRLKEKLLALSITDTAVCNCHSDNRLTEMLSLVLEGYRWAQHGEHERVKYGLRLRRALEDFTQVFLPHMEEEEEVFQPMLIEYFTYEELKELKVKVIQKHFENAEECEKADTPASEVTKTKSPRDDSKVHSLPDEVMLNIFSYLSPRDLTRCAQVSGRWNRLSLDPLLWPTIHPVQWAAGDWSFHPAVKEEEEAADGKGTGSFLTIYDEDADIDESSDSEGSDAESDTNLQQALREVKIISGLVRHVLKRVGGGVRICNLAHCRGVSSSLVHKILKLCPNLHTLSLAHTKITDAAFKEYGLKGGVSQLEHLDLTGCENVTDVTLSALAGCTFHPHNRRSVSSDSCPSVADRHSASYTDTMTIEVDVPGNKKLVSAADTVTSLSAFHISEICKRENLTQSDPSFTELSVLGVELCSLGCLERSDQISGNGRGCCQTKDLFPCPEGKKKNVRMQKKKSRDEKRSACETNQMPKTGCCSSRRCGSVDTGVNEGLSEGPATSLPQALQRLRFLSLSGCFRIQDDGLRVLSERGGLPWLHHLDLSGCMNLTGVGIARLVDVCPSLDHAQLFYCDNIYPDPFPTTASGCRNLQCSTRVCCRSGE